MRAMRRSKASGIEMTVHDFAATAKRLNTKAQGSERSERTLGSLRDVHQPQRDCTGQGEGGCGTPSEFDAENSAPRVGSLRSRPWALESNRFAVAAKSCNEAANGGLFGGISRGCGM